MLYDKYFLRYDFLKIYLRKNQIDFLKIFLWFYAGSLKESIEHAN